MNDSNQEIEEHLRQLMTAWAEADRSHLQQFSSRISPVVPRLNALHWALEEAAKAHPREFVKVALRDFMRVGLLERTRAARAEAP